jgi:hypothetical protein
MVVSTHSVNTFGYIKYYLYKREHVRGGDISAENPPKTPDDNTNVDANHGNEVRTCYPSHLRKSAW